MALAVPGVRGANDVDDVAEGSAVVVVGVARCAVAAAARVRKRGIFHQLNFLSALEQLRSQSWFTQSKRCSPRDRQQNAIKNHMWNKLKGTTTEFRDNLNNTISHDLSLVE